MKRIALLSMFVVALAAAPANARAFNAQLGGDQEAPPVETTARGHIVLIETPNGVNHNLVVNNAENVVAAHLHCAPAGTNGPVGVTLFAGAPVTKNGVLTQGEILAPNSGNGCGWADLDDLLDAVRAGDVYVNVHTLDNLAGEIRGQLD